MCNLEKSILICKTVFKHGTSWYGTQPVQQQRIDVQTNRAAWRKTIPLNTSRATQADNYLKLMWNEIKWLVFWATILHL